jgi:hypothetical protein
MRHPNVTLGRNHVPFVPIAILRHICDAPRMAERYHLTRPMERTQARIGRDLRDELEDRYHRQGQTTTEIGVDFGVSASTVARWMARLGIEVRFPGQRGTAA